ncbi:MAG TPA: PAS domain-containing protein [Steroidobacteraceae bacterium]|nr:PAS domain-containing protein [Steroidobacteraceae bacterium]
MARKSSLTEHRLLERLSIATQAAGIFVWEFDWRAKTISWDQSRLEQPASNRHYGQELGSDLFKWVHPEDQNIGRNVMADALARGEADASFRYRLRLADGSIRHIQAYARTSADEAGQPLRSLGVSWDITQEVEAAEQLRRIAEHERMLLEHLSIATHAAGMECFEYDYRQDKFTWFYGLHLEGRERDLSAQDLGQLVMAAVLPEDAARVRVATEAALERGESSMTARMRRRGPDGQVRHIQLYQRFIRDEQGRPSRALGAARDITVEVEAAERFRQQAEELHDAQRRLERASLSIHEGHWESDLVSRKHWASSSYCALLGYRPEELKLDDLDQVSLLIHPDDRLITKELSSRHMAAGTPYEHELRLRLRDGQYRWFSVRAQAERDAEGHPIRLSGSIRDVHKQKLVEDELQAARQRFERAIRGTQDGLWEWDLVQQRLWVSPRYEAILGHAEGAVSGSARTPNDLVHPDDLQSCEAAQRAHFERGVPYDMEVRMRTASGSFRWIRMRGEADRDDAGRTLRLAGAIQDVTEARAARDALIQASEAAQAASRSKSAFLANVSHEIRTPMNGIIGMTSLLLNTALDATQRDYAETIHTSADSLLAVINDILDLSKIEAGRLDIESIPMSLPESISDVRTMLAFQAAAKGLRLEARVRPEVPRWVRGDPQRIRQCLVNLISNAVKFTSTGEVIVELLVAGQENGRVSLRFEVRDTGIGIAPQTLPTLFQPFVQADSSTTRHFGGTGLGLSIVRRLVEMMGGQVGVSSQLGQGSTFWFVLPLQIAQAPPLERPPAALAAQPLAASASPARISSEPRFERAYAGRVLLVEDNAVNQKVARAFLERMGCEVAVAVNGVEAVQSFQQQRFALVLIDLQMPLMDGYTATSRMRELEGDGARTPIVALTASAMMGQLERCLQGGMDGLITKPLNITRLREVLDRFGLRASEAASECGTPEPRVLDEAAIAELVTAPAEDQPLELARLQEITGGDAEFSRDLERAFLTNSAALLAMMSQCADRGDRQGLCGAAHSLKGASANIHARPLRALCETLETLALSATQNEIRSYLQRLGGERERVVRALQAFTGSVRSTTGIHQVS